MLWFPRVRLTRSGRPFSPYGVSPLPCPDSVDFGRLLEEATLRDSEELEEEGAEVDAIGVTAKRPPSPQRLEAPEAKRVRQNDPQVPASSTSQQHAKRRRQREAARQLNGHVPRAKTLKAHVQPATPVFTALATEGLPATSCGYQAVPKGFSDVQKAYTLPELMSLGLRLIRWDGYESRPIYDLQKRIIACLVGQPRDPTYAASVEAVHLFFLLVAENAQLKPSVHARGQFPVLNVGITHSLGTKRPVRVNNHGHTSVAEQLLGNPHLQRLASFASAAFALWAPRIYQYYRSHLDQLYSKMPHLHRNFDGSVFPSAAFNFGPNVWTFKHQDSMNCPFGWCAIQALGHFDPKAGGHLILWDLGLVIEFPPGALILIPSATLTHSNVPVQSGDTCQSFTQYCAGGLFRYVDNGFRTEAQLGEEDPAALAQALEMKKTRWKMGLGLFSTLDDLLMQIE